MTLTQLAGALLLAAIFGGLLFATARHSSWRFALGLWASVWIGWAAVITGFWLLAGAP